MRCRLSDGDPDVAINCMRKDQPQVGISLGEVDVLRRFQSNVIVDRCQAWI